MNLLTDLIDIPISYITLNIKLLLMTSVSLFLMAKGFRAMFP